MNGAFETIKHSMLPGHSDLDRLVVLVAAHLTRWHRAPPSLVRGRGADIRERRLVITLNREIAQRHDANGAAALAHRHDAAHARASPRWPARPCPKVPRSPRPHCKSRRQ